MYEIESNSFIKEKNRSLEYAGKLSEYKGEIQLVVEELASINMEEIGQSLSIIEDMIENESSYIRILSDAMERIEECYSNSEDDVIDNLKSFRNLNGNRYDIGFFDFSYDDKRVDPQLMRDLLEMIQ